MSQTLTHYLTALRAAAQAENFTEAAKLLKKFLEPLRDVQDLPSYEREPFDIHDNELISLFWRRMLDYHSRDNFLLRRATCVYGIVLAASVDPQFPALQTEAGVSCQSIVLICKELEPQSRIESTITRLPPPVRDIPPSASGQKPRLTIVKSSTVNPPPTSK